MLPELGLAGYITLLSAVTAAIISLINAFGTARLNYRTGIIAAESKAAKEESIAAKEQGQKNQTKIEEMHKETIEVSAKADETLNNTNGHLSELRTELRLLQERNEKQQEMINQLSTILSAQRAAGGPTGGMQIGSRTSDAPLKVQVVDTPTEERRDKK